MLMSEESTTAVAPPLHDDNQGECVTRRVEVKRRGAASPFSPWFLLFFAILPHLALLTSPRYFLLLLLPALVLLLIPLRYLPLP